MMVTRIYSRVKIHITSHQKYKFLTKNKITIKVKNIHDINE